MRKLVLWSVLILTLVTAVIGVLSGRFLSQYFGGKELWLAWRAERIAKGDRFEWSQLIPPDVPDSENFAKAPLIAGAIGNKGLMDPRFKALELPKVEGAWGDWKEGRRVDLEAYQTAYGTKDLLKALAPYAPGLKDLNMASLRPHSKIPVDYRESEIPSLMGFRAATRVLCVRALARLSSGNSEGALEDSLTCIRIANHFKAEPNLLASLLRQAILGNVVQIIWEGLEDHRWNERQLRILQDELLRMDVLASARLGWEGERLQMIESLTRTAEGLPQPKGLQDSSNPKTPVHLGVLGKGWFYRNLLEMDGYYVTSFLDILDPKAHRVYPEKFISGTAWVEARKHRKDLVMALIAAPALSGQTIRQAQLQSYLDQAAVACALERYRLAKGEYPSELNQLSPAFMEAIPWDITTGQPLRFSRHGNSFQLYSVGWDRNNDGGALTWKTEKGKRALDIEKGDWAWMHAIP